MTDETLAPDIFDKALILDMPILIKARTNFGGKRLIEMEASNTQVDKEGDCVLQEALLKAAPDFIKHGALDLEHLSEIGSRLGIENPTDYIVGVPLEVLDKGQGRTFVRGQLHDHVDGTTSRADNLWESLTRSPPVRWRASIFGYPKTGDPDSFFDCRIRKCPEAPEATRYVIKSMTWKSLAFTRSPMNDSIEGAARIVSAKAYLANAILKGDVGLFGPDNGAMRNTIPEGPPPEATAPVAPVSSSILPMPRNRVEMLGHFTHHIQDACPYCGEHSLYGKSVAGFRNHFMQCCGADYPTADIYALALMHALKHYQ